MPEFSISIVLTNTLLFVLWCVTYTRILTRRFSWRGTFIGFALWYVLFLVPAPVHDPRIRPADGLRHGDHGPVPADPLQGQVVQDPVLRFHRPGGHVGVRPPLRDPPFDPGAAPGPE